MQLKTKWLIGMFAAVFVAVTLVSQVQADMGGYFGNIPTASLGTFETTVVTADTASAGNLGKGSVLYGFKLWSGTAGGVAALYDSTTLGGATATQGVFIDEGGEATQYDVWQSSWPAPYILVNDLTVVMDQAPTVVVYHDAQ